MRFELGVHLEHQVRQYECETGEKQPAYDPGGPSALLFALLGLLREVFGLGVQALWAIVIDQFVERTLARRLARRRANPWMHAFGGPRLSLFVVVGFEPAHFIFEFLAQQRHVKGRTPESRIGEGAKFQQAQIFGFISGGQPFFLELEALADADQQERNGCDDGFRPGKGYLTGPKDEFENGDENG